MSEFYVYGDTLIPNTVARSVDLKAEFEAIETGLDKLPTEAQIKLGTAQYGTEAGAANAYLVTLPYTPAAYTAGMVVRFKAANSNTGASTVNVNSKGVKNIVRPDGAALHADDISASGVTTLVYDGTNFVVTGALVGVVNEAAAQVTLAAAQVTLAAGQVTLADAARVAAEAAQTAAEQAETDAGVVLASTQAVYDSFDDRYLGAKAIDPSTDNDLNALATGALYWNTASNEMRVWSGSAWSATYAVSVAASQAEMEAGTESALRSMSPLRVAQAIAALGPAPIGTLGAANTVPLTLTNTSPAMQVLTASTFGRAVTLPDATTMNTEGVNTFGFHNSSSYPIAINDSAGTLLGFVESGQQAIAALYDNSTAAGLWRVMGAVPAATDAQALVTFTMSSFTPAQPIAMQAIVLDADRTIVINYSGSGAHGIVYDASTGTFGAWTAIRTADVRGSCSAVKVATDSVLVASCTYNSTALQAVILSISGTTITVNTAATDTLAGNINSNATGTNTAMNGLEMAAATAGAVITYQRSSNHYARVLSVSGTTVTIGAESSALASASGSGSAVIYSLSGTAFIAFGLNSGTGYHATPFTYSGTTVTVGTGVTFTVDAGPIPALSRQFGNGKLAVIYLASSTIRGAVVSVSANVATQTNVALLTSVITTENVVLGVPTTDKLIVFDQGKANVLTDNAGTAVAGTAVTASFTSAEYNQIAVVPGAVYVGTGSSSTNVCPVLMVTESSGSAVITVLRMLYPHAADGTLTGPQTTSGRYTRTWARDCLAGSKFAGALLRMNQATFMVLGVGGLDTATPYFMTMPAVGLTNSSAQAEEAADKRWLMYFTGTGVHLERVRIA